MTKGQYHLLNTLRWHARGLVEGTDFPWTVDYPVDFDRVEAVSEKVLSCCLKWLSKKSDPGETACLFDSYLLAGRVKLLRSNFEGARERFSKGLELAEKTSHRIDGLALAELKQNLGSSLDLLDREEEALDYLRQALDMMERVDPVPLESVANLSNNLGLIYRNQKDFEKAEEHYMRAREVFEKLGEKSSIELALVYNNLGTLYWAVDELDAAEAQHQLAYDLRCKVLPKTAADIGQSASNLAVIFHQKGEFSKAETLYKKAIKVLEKSDEEDPALFETVTQNYSSLLEEKGELRKAAKVFDGLK